MEYGMKAKIYAPILITTLNRYKHLKKVIEGLKCCSEAVESDLYISVDFPPSLKYEDGYNKICEYLKKGIDGFKSVTIIYQKKNLGALDNSMFIEKIVQDKGYDFYILLEDDMVPMPAFLDYMNKCYEMFKDEDKVVGIGGWETLIRDTGEYNAVYTHFGACLGLFAKRRKDIINAYSNYEYFERILRDGKIRKRVADYRKDAYWKFVVVTLGLDDKLKLRDGGMSPIDYVSDTIFIVEDMYSIFPIKSLIRNTGLDGSGVHAGIVDEVPGDYYKDEQIEVKVLSREKSREIEYRVNNSRNYDKKMYIRCKILVLLYLLFGRKFTKRINDGIEKIHLVKMRIKEKVGC